MKYKIDPILFFVTLREKKWFKIKIYRLKTFSVTKGLTKFNLLRAFKDEYRS